MGLLLLFVPRFNREALTVFEVSDPEETHKGICAVSAEFLSIHWVGHLDQTLLELWRWLVNIPRGLRVQGWLELAEM